MEWSAKYVGLPYRRFGRDRSGLDCWGLVRLALLEEKGIRLPLYDTVGEGDVGVRDVIDQERRSDYWQPVSTPNEFDLVRMNIPLKIDGRTHWCPVHIGIVAPRGYLLHIGEGDTSNLELLSDHRGQIVEFVRHKELT